MEFEWQSLRICVKQLKAYFEWVPRIFQKHEVEPTKSEGELSYLAT